MNLEVLKNNVGEWLKGGPEDDVVISSRVRLARNIEGYTFVQRASDQQIARIEELLRNKVLACIVEPELSYFRLNDLEDLALQLLVERHLISRDHARADWIRGVAFDRRERLSVMVNEEDHLRVQMVCGGLRLQDVWEQVNRIDDQLSSEIPFAFSPKYGYLAACPTNAGTGMRASIMVHLPALVLTREVEQIVAMANDERLALRGLYGEGTEASGDLYQISNQVTLGHSEEEIIEQVSEVVARVVSTERAARANLSREHRPELTERINRALSLLLKASMISSEEALHFLSQVKMGIEMGIVEDISSKTLNELFLLTLPAHLQTIGGRSVGSKQQNQIRAAYVRERLGSP